MRLIDADELKKVLCEEYEAREHYIGEKMLEAIDNAPTVSIDWGNNDGDRTVYARPQGKWVKIFENPFTNGYVCPFCGHKIQVTEQFLPKVTECEVCGADMRGKE